MTNTLIRDNYEEITRLSNTDAKIVMDYFVNWTPQEPAYYSDGKRQQDKLEFMFAKYLKQKGYEYNYELSETIQEYCSYIEYSIDSILSIYHQNMSDFEEEFAEWFELYLEYND